MADEIRQDLGFDASQALETINKLNAGFDSLFQTLSASPRAFDSFNQRGQQTLDTLIKIQAQVKSTTAALSSVGGVNAGTGNAAGAASSTAQAAAAQQLTQAVGTATVATNQLGQATVATGNASTNALKQSTRAAGGFALSLETITRVLGTQLIVRSLGGIQRGIEESFGDFIKLQNGLATIRTISTDSINSLETELTGLSNAFNVPLLEVVQAKYEILQNGFESTSESVDILTASLKFARVANTDAAQSADLVSSSLNAYGEAASQAETLTAKLVETIQLGRIKGSELVSALGRVSPIAKELGVSMDEVLAAFSSITIGATRTAEAATQVRSTLASLLKPSDDMKVAFKKLGVETGDQAIQTFGFKGALEALIGTTNGSTHAIAQLFPNFRALTGVLREAGSGADVFDRHLKEIQQTANAVLNKKLDLRIDTDAEKVTADFNKFANFLTTEVGKSLVQTTAQAVGLVGGIDNIIAAARGLAPTLGFASAALVTYGLVAGGAAAANRLFNTSLKDANLGLKLFGGALSVVTAIFAGVQASESFDQFVLGKVDQGRKKLQAEGEKILADQREKDGARLELAKVAQQQQQQQLNLQIASTQRAYSEQLDIAKVANQQLVDDDKSALDRIIEARDRFATDLKRAAQKAEDQSRDSFSTSQKEIIKLLDERFNREQKNRSSLAQFQNANQRAEQLFARGQNELLHAKTDEEIKSAHSTFDRAEGFRQQAIEAGKVAGIMQSQFEINRQLDRDAQRRIDTEIRFQKIREADAQKLRQQAADEDKRNDKLKVLAKEFLDKSKLFDKNGNRLPSDQIAKNIQDANAALAKFQELALGKGSKANVTDLLSFDSLQRRLEEKMVMLTSNSLRQLRSRWMISTDRFRVRLKMPSSLSRSLVI
jgi:TP901 family phage tail tape measure protein